MKTEHKGGKKRSLLRGRGIGVYPGQYYDSETGLHYNYFRYYNPQTGRYITPDPIGLEGGINLFLYADANPVNLADPSGLDVYLDPKMVERWQQQIDWWNIQIENSWLPDFLKQFLYRSMSSDLMGSMCGPLGDVEFIISDKIIRQMAARGWTKQVIEEAIQKGERIPAINKATGGSATRYVHPKTGQSVVVDNATGQVIHVGGSGFKYGPKSGDVR